MRCLSEWFPSSPKRIINTGHLSEEEVTQYSPKEEIRNFPGGWTLKLVSTLGEIVQDTSKSPCLTVSSVMRAWLPPLGN